MQKAHIEPVVTTTSTDNVAINRKIINLPTSMSIKPQARLRDRSESSKGKDVRQKPEKPIRKRSVITAVKTVINLQTATLSDMPWNEGKEKVSKSTMLR